MKPNLTSNYIISPEVRDRINMQVTAFNKTYAEYKKTHPDIQITSNVPSKSRFTRFIELFQHPEQRKANLEHPETEMQRTQTKEIKPHDESTMYDIGFFGLPTGVFMDGRIHKLGGKINE